MGLQAAEEEGSMFSDNAATYWRYPNPLHPQVFARLRESEEI